VTIFLVPSHCRRRRCCCCRRRRRLLLLLLRCAPRSVTTFFAEASYCRSQNRISVVMDYGSKCSGVKQTIGFECEPSITLRLKLSFGVAAEQFVKL
jgi:hypothetical protein